jgi:hypothetical protein
MSAVLFFHMESMYGDSEKAFTTQIFTPQKRTVEFTTGLKSWNHVEIVLGN